MLAHNFQKSAIGNFGFDTLNLFTNDQIYCSGFNPSPGQIDVIGKFLLEIKRNFSDIQSPQVCLYITFKKSMYYVDIKIDHQELIQAFFAETQNESLETSFYTIIRKLFGPVH